MNGAVAASPTGSVEWATPQHIFDRYDRIFRFTLDPCSTHENAKCAKHYTAEDDGLAQDWGQERVFMNPPYGRTIAQWMQKAYESSLNGALVVCLIPANTDTRWWWEWAVKGQVYFLKGRIKFEGASSNGPAFGSAIVIFWPPELGFTG